jgi:hypothetical protein
MYWYVIFRKDTSMARQSVFEMKLSKIYSLLIAKAVKKGRTIGFMDNSADCCI